MEISKKGKLLKMRGEIQDMIETLNNEFIRGNANYDTITRDVAYEVRDELIQADNLINAYRLRHR